MLFFLLRRNTITKDSAIRIVPKIKATSSTLYNLVDEGVEDDVVVGSMVEVGVFVGVEVCVGFELEVEVDVEVLV